MRAGENAAAKEGAMFYPGNESARVFLLGSLSISLLCLFYIAKYRLGIEDRFSIPIFWHLLVTQDFWAALLILGMLALAYSARDARPVLMVVRILAGHPYAVAGIAFVALSAGAILVYHDYALSMDEYSARFQSQVFAAGELTGRFPPELIDWLIPAPFQNRFLILSRSSGEVVSYFMPGFSLLLTPFTFLGIPWACTPAIGALSLVVIHRLAIEITGNKEAGGWATLFALASPAFSINAMSYYSMSANLLLSATYALLLLKPTPGRALVAGLVGGLALVMHSPPPHALFATPWLVWLLLRKDYRCLGALVLGYAPSAALLGAGWLWLIGDLRSSVPVQAGAGGAAAGGTHIVSWLASIRKVIGLPDASALIVRTAALVKLWVWAVPGLPLLAWMGFLGGRTDARFRLLLASAATAFLGYCLIPFDQGHGWGYRYFHTAWSVLPVLAAAAMVRATADLPSRSRFVAMVGALGLGSLVLATALRAAQVDTFIERHLGQVPIAGEPGRKVAFVDTDQGYYTTDMVQNDHRLQGKTLIMVSHGPELNAVMARRLSPGARLVSRGAWGELWSLE